MFLYDLKGAKMPKINFDKQLDKTIKMGIEYAQEREKLKTLFCDRYDRLAINTLLNLLSDKGHPSEQEFAKQFREHYTSSNYDEKEIKEFQRLFGKYKDQIINDLEESSDGE